MKAVLISIQPKWCELIASGKKTVEIRKTKPKLETPFKVYIYATKPRHYFKIAEHLAATDENLFLSNGTVKMSDGFENWAAGIKVEYLNGKVIGEFVCDKVYDIKPHFDKPDFCNQYLCDWNWGKGTACLSFTEMNDYLKGEKGCGWHISNLVIYDKPKELGEFYKCGAPSIDELLDIEELCQYCSDTGYGEYKTYGTPNGPVMCEGRFCDKAYQEYLDENFSLIRAPQSWCYVEGVTNERPDKN